MIEFEHNGVTVAITKNGGNVVTVADATDKFKGRVVPLGTVTEHEPGVHTVRTSWGTTEDCLLTFASETDGACRLVDLAYGYETKIPW